jgi:hypothetical protein
MEPQKLSDVLEIHVSITKPRNTALKPNSSGTGMFQMMGVCNANIAVRVPGQEKPLVLFERLHGFIGVSTKTGSDQKRWVVNYDNARKGTEGQNYPSSQPVPDFRDLLHGKTIAALNAGYTEVSYDERIAENAGIDTAEYISYQEACFELAEKLDKQAQATNAADESSTPAAGAETLGNDLEKVTVPEDGQ